MLQRRRAIILRLRSLAWNEPLHIGGAAFGMREVTALLFVTLIACGNNPSGAALIGHISRAGPWPGTVPRHSVGGVSDYRISRIALSC